MTFLALKIPPPDAYIFVRSNSRPCAETRKSAQTRITEIMFFSLINWSRRIQIQKSFWYLSFFVSVCWSINFCFIVLVVFRYSAEMLGQLLLFFGDDEAYDLVLLFFLPGNWLEPYGVITLLAETQVQDLCVFFSWKRKTLWSNLRYF